jgi:hypothetical protein
MEDEESGIVTYDDKIVKRWDGALVRRKAFETRQPQEFVRAKSDPKALKDIRPAQEADRPALGPAYFVGNTNVPAAKGIGHRLTRTGIGKMMIGGSFVIEGEPDDISVTAAALKFNPNTVCPLTAPTTAHVAAGGGIVDLAAGEHKIIVLGSGHRIVEDIVNIRGTPGTDCRFWIIGGEIRNPNEGPGGNHKCLEISNVDKAYVEGVVCDKRSSLGDALVFRGSAAAGGTIWVQNSRLLGGQTSAAGLHGDGFQAQSQIYGAHFYNVTMVVHTQGLLVNSTNDGQFVSGKAIVSGATLDRVNVVLRPTSENTHSTSSRHALYLADSSAAINYSLTNCYVYDPDNTPVDRLVRPSKDVTGYGAVGTWDTAFWPDANQGITGEVRKGRPPGGDYVPEGLAGSNYISPGYRST